MLIYFCKKCGTRVRAEELAAKTAQLIGELEAYCAACHHTQPQLHTAEELQSRSKDSPPTSAPDEVKTARKRLHNPGKTANNSMSFFVAILGGVAVFLLAIILVKTDTKTPPKSVDTVTRPTEPSNPRLTAESSPTLLSQNPSSIPKPTQALNAPISVGAAPIITPAASTDLRKSAEALKAADDLAARNANDPQAAIKAYENIVRDFPGTPEVYDAQLRALRLRSRMNTSPPTNASTTLPNPLTPTTSTLSVETKSPPNSLRPGLASGLWASVWRWEGQNAFGAIVYSRQDSNLTYSLDSGITDPRLPKGNVTVKHHAIWTIPANGQYTLQLKSKGWAKIEVDGKELTSSWDNHVNPKSIFLTQGPHALTVVNCARSLEAKWKTDSCDWQDFSATQLNYDAGKTAEYDSDNK